jgi:3-deoxy-D-manno-octulosonate 8-phosphate phosphatase (KDO 8-P phosphatase)
VADAHPVIVEIADWCTRLGGGRGAVREVCDLLIAARKSGSA